MKILHLVDIPWWSGLSSYALDSYMAHIALGHEATLACERNSLIFHKVEENNCPMIELNGRKPIHAFLNLVSIYKWILKNKPDRLIAHTGSTHWIAWLLGKKTWFELRKKIPVL